MYAQPDQKNTFYNDCNPIILHLSSAEVFLQHCITRKDTVCNVPTTITKSDCTANQIRIYLSFYSNAYMKLTLGIRRLN